MTDKLSEEREPFSRAALPLLFEVVTDLDDALVALETYCFAMHHFLRRSGSRSDTTRAQDSWSKSDANVRRSWRSCRLFWDEYESRVPSSRPSSVDDSESLLVWIYDEFKDLSRRQTSGWYLPLQVWGVDYGSGAAGTGLLLSLLEWVQARGLEFEDLDDDETRRLALLRQMGQRLQIALTMLNDDYSNHRAYMNRQPFTRPLSSADRLAFYRRRVREVEAVQRSLQQLSRTARR